MRSVAPAPLRSRVSSGVGLLALAVAFAVLAGSAPSAEASHSTFSYETHFVTTSDGWELALTRLKPSPMKEGREPVLMLHGFIENHRIYDLDATRSLARYMALRGLDCWILDFRGGGLSGAPSATDLTGWTYSVDDLIHKDVPTAVDYVLAATGRPKLFLMGHSMGGLATYAYCETETQSKIRGIVTLSGAGKMGPAPSQTPLTQAQFLLTGAAESSLPWNGPFPMKATAQDLLINPNAWVVFGPLLIGDIGSTVWDTENMTPLLIHKMLQHAVDNIGMNVVKQFLRWYKDANCYTYGPSPFRACPQHSSWYDSHGFYSYTDHLSAVTVPALLLAGGSDQVVPKENVQWIHDHLGSADKTIKVLSKANGYVVNIGHEDILVGKYSPQIVYPLVTTWVKSRASH
ncbi:MAG: alpha/beta fold hydrolase [Planctomycetes bacterium]|nr:alpha/beta fold hydrolase [Planctomycetota bacterium]